jgi:hypothetical protein
MKLSGKDYQALKLAAELADAQRLLNEGNRPIAETAGPLIGALLGLLLLFGIGFSLVSSERGQREHIAFSGSSSSRSSTVR